MFMEELGIRESGLSRLIKLSYEQLGLISYLTAGPKEVRAWTIERGTRAPQAAGKSTPTLNVDSYVPNASRLTIWWRAGPWRRRRNAAWYAARDAIT